MLTDSSVETPANPKVEPRRLQPHESKNVPLKIEEDLGSPEERTDPKWADTGNGGVILFYGRKEILKPSVGMVKNPIQYRSFWVSLFFGYPRSKRNMVVLSN